MIKKYFKRTIAIVLLFTIVFGVMIVFQTPYGHVVNIIQGFYREPKNSIDVVLVGASEVSAGYSAPFAFEKFGYTSYPYAIDGNQVSMIPYELKEIYAHQSPKIILIDISCMSSYSHAHNDDNYDGRLHGFTDNIPFSENKINTINSLANNSDKTSFYFPFMINHGFLPDTQYAHFLLSGENKLKGTYARSSKIESAGEIYNLDFSEKQIPEKNEKEIVELLECCKNEQYNVIFTRFPNRVNDDLFYKRYQECNYIKSLIKKNGFQFFDCMTNELYNNIDYQNDFYTNDHMSISGQKKLTIFIGATLTKYYDVSKSELSKEKISSWKESEEYVDMFYEYINQIEKQRKPNQSIYYFESYNLIKELDSMKVKDTYE